MTPLLPRIAIALVILGAWYGITGWRISAAKRMPLVLPVKWRSSDPSPPPDMFRFVQFPPAGGLPIVDKPGGTTIGVLRRAVTASVPEQAMEFVPVSDGAATGFIEQALMRCTVPTIEADTMIDAMVRERHGRGPGNADFSLAARLPESTPGEATVLITAGGITSRSVYTISGNVSKPIRFESATRTEIVLNSPVGNARWNRVLLFFPAAALAAYVLRRRR